MISNIRTLTDTDSTDLPDSLCQIFLSEAWRHAAHWKPYWPFYRTTWTYTFTGDGTAYSFTATNLVDPNGDTVPTAMMPAAPNAIEAVFDTTNDVKLKFLDAAEFDRLYRANDDTTGDPRYYTVAQTQYVDDSVDWGWQTGLTFKLWPIPSNGDSIALVIEGFREPINFSEVNEGGDGTDVGGYYSATAANAVPDMPEAFHEAILWYAVGQAFAYLDEGDRSLFYIAKADNVLALQENRWFRGPTLDGPLVLNSGRGYTSGLKARLKYDFE